MGPRFDASYILQRGTSGSGRAPRFFERKISFPGQLLNDMNITYFQACNYLGLALAAILIKYVSWAYFNLDP